MTNLKTLYIKGNDQLTRLENLRFLVRLEYLDITDTLSELFDIPSDGSSDLQDQLEYLRAKFGSSSSSAGAGNETMTTQTVKRIKLLLVGAGTADC